MTCSFHSNPTNPRGRARTLQAQKPTNRLVDTWEATGVPAAGRSTQTWPRLVPICAQCVGDYRATQPSPPPPRTGFLPPVFPSTSLQVLRLGLCIKDKRADPEGGRGAGPCQQRQGAVSPHRTHPPRATFSSLPSRPSAGPSPDPRGTGDLSSSPFPENWASCCS